MRNSEVYLDVYSWIKLSNIQGKTAVNGLFRHAEKLSQFFTPAIALEENEAVPDLSLLPFNPVIFRPSNVPKDCLMWLSLGVDQVNINSFIWDRKEITKATILHDCMSDKGLFGEGNRVLHYFGVANNSVFLSVSQESASLLRKHPAYKPAFQTIIPYGGFSSTAFHDVTFSNNGRDGNSLSVFTLFDYKRIDLVYKIARAYGTKHTHIGQAVFGTAATATVERLKSRIDYLGVVTDRELVNAYRRTEMFIQMSEVEGFSLPPFEAIVCGVPHIVLSDIPTHREIYGKYNVNFVPLDAYIYPQKLSRITKEDIDRAKEEFSFPNAIAPFLKYLTSLG